MQVLGNQSYEVQSFYRLYHNDTMYCSAHYGKRDGKRNSTVCCYKQNNVQKFGVIQKFVAYSQGINVALITPFKPTDRSLLGNPFENYTETDLLSAFIITVETFVLYTFDGPVKQMCICNLFQLRLCHKNSKQF